MILMLNRTEFVESVLAANMIGAIGVPINFRLTPPEIAFLVEDCEARVVITESVLAPVAAGVRNVTSVLKTIVVAGDSGEDGLLSYEDLVNEPGEPAQLVDVPNDSPALIMYTSGTTGRPKGAVLTPHQPRRADDVETCFTHGVDAHDVGFIGVPFFHIAGIGNLLTGLLMGLPHGDSSAGRISNPDICSMCWPPNRSRESSWFRPNGKRYAMRSRRIRAR